MNEQKNNKEIYLGTSIKSVIFLWEEEYDSKRLCGGDGIVGLSVDIVNVGGLSLEKR